MEEINTGIYCFSSPEIWPLLEKIGFGNRQGEYYLTDVVHLMVESHLPLDTVAATDPQEICGINSRRALSEAERIFQERSARRFQDNGVTIIRPEATYIEAEVAIGPETVVYPFTVIERGARIGRGCRIGPFLHLKSGEIIADNSEVKGNIKLF